MAIIFHQTDLASGCGPTAACSPNGLGANPVTGRACLVDGVYGTQEVTVTMAASETAKIYVMLEFTPAARVTWAAGDCLLGFRVTTPNANVSWVRTDLCHTDASCTSLETLAVDTVPVSVGPAERDFVTKLIPGFIAAVVPITTGDKVLMLLSFSNNTALPQSFGWTPSLDVTLPWLDRGIEIVAHMGKAKKKVPRDILGNPIARPEEEVLLMLGDEEPFG
jgi:hypothetical protein